jgi:hypothetical protein
MKKLIYIVLVVALVLVAGTYLYQEGTNDRVVYSSSQYGFQFSYPKTFTIGDGSGDPTGSNDVSLLIKNPDNKDVFVYVLKNYSWDSYSTNTDKIFREDGIVDRKEFPISNRSKTVINGLTIDQGDYEYSSGTYDSLGVKTKNGPMLHFVLISDNHSAVMVKGFNGEASTELVSDIVSSFVFTKK